MDIYYSPYTRCTQPAAVPNPQQPMAWQMNINAVDAIYMGDEDTFCLDFQAIGLAAIGV